MNSLEMGPETHLLDILDTGLEAPRHGDRCGNGDNKFSQSLRRPLKVTIGDLHKSRDMRDFGGGGERRRNEQQITTTRCITQHNTGALHVMCNM